MDIFLKEYTSNDAIKRYSKTTAGYGINFLLTHDYLKVYKSVIDNFLPDEFKKNGLRIMEFGCGTGMNLLCIVSLLNKLGIPLQEAIGTDFSSTLIEKANVDKSLFLPKELDEKVHFIVARNENLSHDLAENYKCKPDKLLNTFHLIIGINTIRYCHRINKEKEFSQILYNLLLPRGLCIVIDMNDKCPLYLSVIKNKFTKKKEERNNIEFFIPSLDQYAQSFQDTGFTILEKRKFCWIPHSSGYILTHFMRIVEPLLNIIAHDYATRSMLIVKKPHP